MKLGFFRNCALAALVAVFSLYFTSCPSSGGGNENPPGPTGGEPWTWTGTPTAAQINKTASLKVFFAHASVGENTLRGIMRIGAPITYNNTHWWNNDEQLKTAIINLGDRPAIIGYNQLGQGAGGGNGNPASKITAFRNTMNNIVQNKVDIAFMKFCPVDVISSGPPGYDNVQALFNDYKATMDQLVSAYPTVLFVHATKGINRENAPWGNSISEDFNDLLREQYGELVFDVAAIEALRSDGATATAPDNNGRTARAMANEWGAPGPASTSPDGYTYGNYDPNSGDVNHLNTAGQNRMGQSLVAFLAWISDKYLSN